MTTHQRLMAAREEIFLLRTPHYAKRNEWSLTDMLKRFLICKPLNGGIIQLPPVFDSDKVDKKFDDEPPQYLKQ